ncbi:MAG: MFS transporter [Rhodocyclales bacterium]|nr:MFS transporter [Rhodocyclales bacterium]
MAALGAALVARAPALGQRNFRRYFFGQVCSVLGTFIQAVAMSWLVYRLTGSAALLGLAAFLSQAPQLLVSPLAGVVVDRFDRRRILIGLQCLFALQALLLAGLVFFDLVQVWHLLALSALLGILNSFDLPSRQSLLLYLVDDRATLANAVAINAAVTHGGRFVGPPIAGLLLAALPESACFLINALSYLGPILAVRAIRADIPRQYALRTGRALVEVVDFIKQQASARAALAAVALINATASSYVVLMPIFAKEIFAGDSRTLGWLLGMGGAGALTASLYLSTRPRAEQVAGALPPGCLLAGCGMLGFAAAGLVDAFWLALPTVWMIGAGVGASNVAGNTRLQYLVPDRLRGRIVAIFASSRFGFDALGGLLAGTLAAHFSVLPVVFGQGLLLVGGCLWLLPRLRQRD